MGIANWCDLSALEKLRRGTYFGVQKLVRLQVLPLQFDQGFQVEDRRWAVWSIVTKFRELFQVLSRV
jgi:hypothetical protein